SLLPRDSLSKDRCNFINKDPVFSEGSASQGCSTSGVGSVTLAKIGLQQKTQRLQKHPTTGRSVKANRSRARIARQGVDMKPPNRQTAGAWAPIASTATQNCRQKA